MLCKKVARGLECSKMKQSQNSNWRSGFHFIRALQEQSLKFYDSLLSGFQWNPVRQLQVSIGIL
jgi:hypothetical protein